MVVWCGMALGGAATGAPSDAPAAVSATGEGASAQQATTVRGFVKRGNGSPVADAVIVSSLGGQAVSRSDGSFALTVDVPVDSPCDIGLTAVATIGGVNHVGSTSANRAINGGIADAGAIMLAASTGAPTCEEMSWLPMLGGDLEMSGLALAFAVFDDGMGRGPALYVGGGFATAGGVTVNGVARWNGASWSALGSGVNTGVNTLAVFDDGSGGPALYAGGSFTMAGGVTVNRIARWDGTSWSALGSGMDSAVNSFAVFDDGSGSRPVLYAGGSFESAGGMTANRVARWDGTSWSALGSGVDNTVYALAVFDDGSGGGPALYAGGSFASAGGATVNRVARWDGFSWSPLASGMNSSVYDFAVFDDGAGGGPALYAGGNFTMAGGVVANRIAKWNGASWTPLGSGASGAVEALAVLDDGSGGGPALYAGGLFATVGGVTVNRIARWDGASWLPLGSGMDGEVSALAVFNDGSGGGPALFAGGAFAIAGGVPASGIAQWDRASWLPLGSGVSTPVAEVSALAVFDDGSGGGPALYAGGLFTLAGGVPASGIARWDGASWLPLGSGIAGWVHALAVFDDGFGGGPALYAGGIFSMAGGMSANRIAKWNGASWSPLGSGMSGGTEVRALAVFDDGSGGGPALYAGGWFTMAGGVSANRIAKWNGASWTPLGSGMNLTVFALAAFDDGSGDGPALYAGGNFTMAGGVVANGIAKWNGASWTPLGSGMGGAVLALAVFDDGLGEGPALYAGGGFTMAGGMSAKGIARWNGASWSPLGQGLTGVSGSGTPSTLALAVFDDGSGGGPALYTGGNFTTAGGGTVNRIARWDGSSWSPLGSGVSTPFAAVSALAVFDDGLGGGPALFVGGDFPTSPAGDSYLAKWGCEGVDPCAPADFNCDGVVDGTDLVVVLGAWGKCGSPPCAADLSGDGVIDGNDLAILLGGWG